MKNSVLVIGAGLAGSEAAWQLVQRGIPVELVEMRPVKLSPAHHTALFAELVCSNSLRAANIENAVGLLKEEMRCLGSLIMEAADTHRVPAGGALAVDRVPFSILPIISRIIPWLRSVMKKFPTFPMIRYASSPRGR